MVDVVEAPEIPINNESYRLIMSELGAMTVCSYFCGLTIDWII